MRRTMFTLATAAVMALSPLLSAPVSAAGSITSTAAPTVGGTARFGNVLKATGGTWDPTDVSLTYAWLRGGSTVGTGQTYAIRRTADLGQRLRVRVTAAKDGQSVSSVSLPTRPVARATFTNTARPKITGTPKFRKRLTRTTGSWSRSGLSFTTRWYRDGKPIRRATRSRYTLAPSDVGRRITVRVKATRQGFVSGAATSARTPTIRHLRPVRRTVTYRIATKGKVTASLATFRRLARETYADPRGWRAMGIAFKEVTKGGDFTLVLSQASKVPTFSSGCSSTYSCRVGRHVIINQTRWQKATPAWKSKRGTLTNYRRLVINHETGHWLGRGHAKCSGKGDLAPVMQQQSKGLGGCHINPWPKRGELHSPRFRF